MKVKLTIENSTGKTVSTTIDTADIKPKETSLRKFGVAVARGIHAVKPLGYSVNYTLEQGSTKYPKALFTVSNFLAKIMKAIDADKRCSCGNTILCSCHEKCERCEPCVAGGKSAKQLIILADKIRTAAEKLNLMYDDVAENAARDGGYDEDNY